ncbi:hypothetical protein FGADI_1353 [Fusarium gaditjirri]|uniref:Uncharacterized protein n=1 Tax=Fusarium gaditjirri TaxID=282569 RepID=A0A8H4TL06_9HYPO|nr:hypothetical protein FGADI_1353 [Fusarium gaditjirri]
MSDSVIYLDLTEIHFDNLCKFGGTPQMLHALIAAQEEDVKCWSSCPSFGLFVHKLFFQSKNISHLGPLHPAGVASLEESEYSEEIRHRRETSPDNGLATVSHQMASLSPHPSKIFWPDYTDTDNMNYTRSAFPSENFPVSRTMGHLKDYEDNFVHRVAVNDSAGAPQREWLNTRLAFEEHLVVIEKVIQRQVEYCEKIASKSKSGSFNLGAYMDFTYFLPLINSAVLGMIKNGEFAIFEEDDEGLVYLRRNHKIDSRLIQLCPGDLNELSSGSVSTLRGNQPATVYSHAYIGDLLNVEDEDSRYTKGATGLVGGCGSFMQTRKWFISAY